MYWKRQFLRGFNQSEQLALSLGKALCLPVLNRVCYRRHHNKPQKDSDKQSRQNNLRNAFAIQSRNLHLIENKHLAVVDDVVTTSATVREISKLLIKSGAASVVIWALARTPRPGSL
jgi:ComF family protein